jgi:hypothetical protein
MTQHIRALGCHYSCVVTIAGQAASVLVVV